MITELHEFLCKTFDILVFTFCEGFIDPTEATVTKSTSDGVVTVKAQSGRHFPGPTPKQTTLGVVRLARSTIAVWLNLQSNQKPEKASTHTHTHPLINYKYSLANNKRKRNTKQYESIRVQGSKAALLSYSIEITGSNVKQWNGDLLNDWSQWTTWFQFANGDD